MQIWYWVEAGKSMGVSETLFTCGFSSMSMPHQLIPPGKSNDYHFNPLPVCHRWSWPSILWCTVFEEGRLPRCTPPIAFSPGASMI